MFQRRCGDPTTLAIGDLKEAKMTNDRVGLLYLVFPSERLSEYRSGDLVFAAAVSVFGAFNGLLPSISSTKERTSERNEPIARPSR